MPHMAQFVYDFYGKKVQELMAQQGVGISSQNFYPITLISKAGNCGVQGLAIC